MAYWMLTGRYVFTADRPMQIIARHVQTPPVPPSQHSAFPVPARLEDTVLACLMKKPDQRPARARELCERLSRCEVDEPWTREDAQRWWERRMEPEKKVLLEV